MLFLRSKNIIKNCFWFPLVLLLMVVGKDQAKGQNIYATTATKSGPEVTNENKAAASTPGTQPSATAPFANINVSGTATLGGSRSAWLALQFSSVPANTTVFVKVSNSTTSGSGGSFSAQAYNNATLATGSSYTTVTASDGSLYYAVSATGTFNTVRINATGNGGLIIGIGTANIDVLYAFYNTTNTLDCGAVMATNWSGGGALGGTVLNPERAIDGNTSTFSTLTPAALLSSVQQNFYFSGSSNTTDEVKLTLSAPSAALSVALLNNISITAYNGSSETSVWSANLGNVLSLDLLNLLGNGTPITIAVAPGVAFDRISINFGSVLNLFTNLYVHEVERTPPSPTFSVQNATICANQTATLTATNPAAGYQIKWYDVGGVLVYTGPSYTTPNLTATTVYYVATSKIGCSNESLRKPATVTVNPLPAVNPITGTLTVCANQTTTLSNTTPGGVWTSSATAVATVNSSGVVSGVSGGVSTITYTVTDGITGCSNSTTAIVTVYPLPGLTGNLNPAVCSGSPFSYTGISSVSSTSFSWTRATVSGISNTAGSGSTNTISETLINTTQLPINVTYIFTLTANGCPNTTNLVLKVNPKPGPPHIVSQ